jgi:hypothetical protein
MQIYEQRVYVDEEGRKITRLLDQRLVSEQEIEKRKIPEFLGHLVITVQHGPMKTQQEIQFAIPASNLGEAYDKFEEVSNRVMQKLKEDASKPKIALPGGNGKAIPFPRRQFMPPQG